MLDIQLIGASVHFLFSVFSFSDSLENTETRKFACIQQLNCQIILTSKTIRLAKWIPLLRLNLHRQNEMYSLALTTRILIRTFN